MINEILYYVDKLMNVIIFIIMFLFLLIGVYGIYDAHHIYDEVSVGEELKILKEENEEILYESLKQISGDIISWITIDDTSIDYPVVQGKDNTVYLNKNYKGEYSYVGSIFLDYRNNIGFVDNYSIIYGHSLTKGMFSDILKFNKKDYFDKHKSGTLYLENGKYEIEIISFSVVNSHDDIVYSISINNSKGDNKKMIFDYIYEKASNRRNIEYDKDMKYILLSTCSPNNKNERYVLLTRLVNYQEYSKKVDESI